MAALDRIPLGGIRINDRLRVTFPETPTEIYRVIDAVINDAGHNVLTLQRERDDVTLFPITEYGLVSHGVRTEIIPREDVDIGPPSGRKRMKKRRKRKTKKVRSKRKSRTNKKSRRVLKSRK